MALIRRSYSPAGRFSTRYLPSWLDSTLTVILVFVFWTCTKAPSKGAPSDPFKLPVIVAPGETEARETNKTKNPRVRISTHIALPPTYTVSSFPRRVLLLSMPLRVFNFAPVGTRKKHRMANTMPTGCQHFIHFTWLVSVCLLGRRRRSTRTQADERS